MTRKKIIEAGDMAAILGPLKSAISTYQEALPKYISAMQYNYPGTPPIDIVKNDRHLHKLITNLNQKLAAANDADAIWKKEHERDLEVKKEIIAQKDSLPNPFRNMIRDLEETKERLRSTRRLITQHKKKMGEIRKQMDSMTEWVKSDQPATDEILQALGLSKRAAALRDKAFERAQEAKTIRQSSSRSSRSARSLKSVCWNSLKTSTSPRRSYRADLAQPFKMKGFKAAKKRLATNEDMKSLSSTGKSEYCSVAKKVSFRKVQHMDQKSQSRSSIPRSPSPRSDRSAKMRSETPPRGRSLVRKNSLRDISRQSSASRDSSLTRKEAWQQRAHGNVRPRSQETSHGKANAGGRSPTRPATAVVSTRKEPSVVGVSRPPVKNTNMGGGVRPRTASTGGKIPTAVVVCRSSMKRPHTAEVKPSHPTEDREKKESSTNEDTQTQSTLANASVKNHRARASTSRSAERPIISFRSRERTHPTKIMNISRNAQGNANYTKPPWK